MSSFSKSAVYFKRGGHIEETVGSKGDCVVEKTIKVVIKDESK